MTLVEVIVVLALLGVMTGIVAVGPATLESGPETELVRSLDQARAQAIRSGQPVSLGMSWPDSGTNRAPRTTRLFLPDGSARGPGVDLLTGRRSATR